jgi:hypothetical protein
MTMTFDPNRAFVRWATEHPTRYQRHLEGRTRIKNTKARNADAAAQARAEKKARYERMRGVR